MVDRGSISVMILSKQFSDVCFTGRVATMEQIPLAEFNTLEKADIGLSKCAPDQNPFYFRESS